MKRVSPKVWEGEALVAVKPASLPAAQAELENMGELQVLSSLSPTSEVVIQGSEVKSNKKLADREWP
jgi:hypothetical protein